MKNWVAALACALLSTVALAQDADILVQKTGPATTTPGSNVTYTIMLTNVGADPATTITLTDQIPSVFVGQQQYSMTFVSMTTDPNFGCGTPMPGSGGTITCTSAMLAGGATATFTVTLNVPANTPLGTQFTNIATSSSVDDINDENNSASVVTTIPAPSADISVSKTGPAGAAADTDIVYTITVSNLGPDTASGLSLSDPLPGNLTFVSYTQNSGPALMCTTPTAGSGGTIVCSAASFPAGSTATLSITTHSPAGTPLGTNYNNVATATTTSADPNTENNSSQATTTISAVADISVTKSGNQTVSAGSNIVYTITVANAGPDTAPNVRLTDAIPQNAAFVSFTQDNGPAATCSISNVIDCLFTTLASGASAQFTLTLKAGGSGSIVNTANVNSESALNVNASFDSNNLNNTSTVTTTIIPQADVSVQKTGSMNVVAGNNITYQITVTNNGPSPAANVSLTDTFPANTSFVSLVQDTGPAFNCPAPVASLNCTIASLQSTAQATFTLVLKVGAGAPAGNLTNTATVSTSTTDNTPGNNTSPATTNVTTLADLVMTKTGPATVTAGATVTYTITAANTGPSDAAAANFDDFIPLGTTFAAFTQNSGPTFTCTLPAVGAPQGPNTKVNCTRASLAAGTTATFTLVLNVLPDKTGTLTNIVMGGTSTAESSVNNNIAPSGAANVVVSSDVAMTKTAPATVNAGANLVWTITVVNNGPSTATGVTLADTLPAGTTFVSIAQAGPAFTCTTPAAGANGPVNCNIASLAPATPTTFTVTANVSANAASPIVNTANVASASNDGTPGNNSATATTTIVRADVSIVKTAPMNSASGAPLSYGLTVANAGPSDAAAVTITDTLPAGTTFASLAQNTGAAFTCTTPNVGANGQVSCTIATLANGASASFTLVVNTSPAAAAGAVANTAAVASTTPDANNANNSSTASTNLTPSADLAVTKTGPAGVAAGNTASYAISVVNNGPSVATTVALADTLPAGTTFASFAQNTGPAFTCTTPAVNAAGAVNCTIATLANAATATFTLVVNVLPASTGTFTNTASVGAATADANNANNTSSASTTIGATADLSVTKTGPANVTAGNTASYAISLVNNGPSVATTVALADTLPAGTTFASFTQNTGPAFNCTAPAVNAAGTVNCTIATLANAATATFTLVVNVLPATTGTLANTATVGAATPDAVNANNSSTASTTVGTSADLSLTKTGPANITAGQNATYTVVVSNAGPSNAVNVVVTDTLPANTTFVSTTQTAGPAFNCTTPAVGGAGTISCTIASLANGATATFTIVLNIVPTATGSVTNSASVSSATADPTPGNAAAAAAAAIALAPTDVSLTKTAAFDPVAATKAITWTITVRNLGPGVANNVVVNDLLQPGWTLNSVTSTQGACIGNPQLTCTIGVLASGATAAITLVVTLPSEQTTAINTAVATTDNPDTNAANNTAQSYVQFAPRLIPTLSWSGMLLMILALAALGATVLSRKRDGAA